MKLKKLVELIKENCTSEACETKSCPFLVKSGCFFNDQLPSQWDVDEFVCVIKKAKRLKKNER